MSGRRATPSAGVTLLELLVAVAILSTIATLLYGTFTRALLAREYAAAATERYARARTALDWLQDDLETAYGAGLYPIGAKRFYARGRVDHATLGDTPLLDVTATSARGTAALIGPLFDVDGPRERGDQVRVIYHLEPAQTDETPDATGLDLVRYEFRPPLEIRLEDASRAVVADGIASVELRFFDGAAWHSEWDSASAEGTSPSEQPRPLPSMVQIRLRLADLAEPAELVSGVALALGGPRG
jgi:prepilin-type N-terminal cleavage/methylation domain-containing protein